MTIEEIVREVSGGPNMLVLSGGEPTMQLARKPELLFTLKALGFEVHLETNGTFKLTDAMHGAIAHISCSPKHKVALDFCDDLKLLFPFLPTVDADIIETFDYSNLFIQPIWVHPEEQNRNMQAAIDWVLEHHKARLSVQMHKFTGLR